MPIPDFQTIMLPFLTFLKDEKEHSLSETVEGLEDDFELSEEERKTKLPSGKQGIFRNRVGWTRTYLSKAGLIESTKRAYFRITERGKDVLSENPSKIDKCKSEKGSSLPLTLD